MDKNKAYFMLPGFWEHRKVYEVLNNFLARYPEAKRDEAEIYCYYGNFSFCPWDGGRVFTKYSPANLTDMAETIHYYNNVLNSRIRFVFTNNLLEKQHLNDRYTNIELEIARNTKNEIVLNSDILEEYLNENFPEYRLISSTTKCLNAGAEKNELSKSQYKFICLDYNLNHNWAFLDNLTKAEKDKTEFLVNPICGPACPQRKMHYRLNSIFALSYGKSYKMKSCEITPETSCALKNKTVISPNELYTTYLDKGFHYFKLEGRTWADNEIVMICADYLIKPEYQSFFCRYSLNLI